jgi:hypothetical protein
MYFVSNDTKCVLFGYENRKMKSAEIVLRRGQRENDGEGKSN